MATERTQPAQVVRDYVAWENGDDTKVDVVSKSLDMYNPGLPGGEVHSREPLAKYLREIRERFPDVRFDIEDLAVHDDIVMAEVRITGTGVQGAPADGSSGRIACDEYMACRRG